MPGGRAKGQGSENSRPGALGHHIESILEILNTPPPKQHHLRIRIATWKQQHTTLQKCKRMKCLKTHVFSYRKMMGERRRLHGSDATRTIRDACAQLLHAKVSEPDRAGHEFFQKGKSADILPSQKSCKNKCI